MQHWTMVTAQANTACRGKKTSLAFTGMTPIGNLSWYCSYTVKVSRKTQYSVSRKLILLVESSLHLCWTELCHHYCNPCYLDTVYPEHGHVVAAVQSEAHYVQSKEVEIQTNHTAIK